VDEQEDDWLEKMKVYVCAWFLIWISRICDRRGWGDINGLELGGLYKRMGMGVDVDMG
jgi:hypothetical protein